MYPYGFEIPEVQSGLLPKAAQHTAFCERFPCLTRNLLNREGRAYDGVLPREVLFTYFKVSLPMIRQLFGCLVITAVMFRALFYACYSSLCIQIV